MLLFILILQRYKSIIVVVWELHYERHILVKLLKTYFLCPQVQLVIFEYVQYGGFFLIQYWSQQTFVFFCELFAIKTLNVYFPELIETLIFRSLGLETIVSVGEFLRWLFDSLRDLLRRRIGGLDFAFVFSLVILFDMLSFSDGVMFIFRDWIGIVFLIKVVLFHRLL